MSTDVLKIRQWLERGKVAGATHLIVVFDRFNGEDYPVWVLPDQDANAVYNNISGQDGQRVMEVFDLGMDWRSQLLERPAFHLPESKPPQENLTNIEFLFHSP